MVCVFVSAFESESDAKQARSPTLVWASSVRVVGSTLSPSSSPSARARRHGHVVCSAREPAAVPVLVPGGDADGGEWQGWGWGPEDRQAVEDAERFDDITVGFMDEEQERMRAAAEVRDDRVVHRYFQGRDHPDDDPGSARVEQVDRL